MLSIVCRASSEGGCNEKDCNAISSECNAGSNIRVVSFRRARVHKQASRIQFRMISNEQKRLRDIAESHHLLLELLTCEPFLQECLQLIESMCLSRELDFSMGGGKAPTQEFKAFVNRNYYHFLKSALRQAHGLGFVVWCIRRLPSGDKVAEVLPLGTFTWTIEPDTSGQRSLRYKIQLNIKEVPYTITEWVQPSYNVTEGSILHATVPTPLAHLIEEYKILRETMRRYHHADAWNTTARLVVSSEPKQFNHEASQKEVFETLDFLRDAIESKRKHSPSQVERAFLNAPASNHRELVYELPAHHHLENTPVLKPVVDIQFVTSKFRHSVCSLLGIPPEMIVADRTSQRESRGAKATSRIFQGRMARMCIFLADLLREVFQRVYKEEATFNLIALPRLEVQSIEELKILHEIGVLQPDHALKLSEILLGSTRKSESDHNPAATKKKKLEKSNTDAFE